MCDWTYAAAALLSAYGANQQAEAQNDAAERQQQAINAQLEQQDKFSRIAEGKAMDNAQEYDMTKRTDRLEDAKTQAGESLAQSLVKSREDVGTPTQASGKLSDAFTADRASRMADQFQESVDMAKLMGRMRGVNDMLGNEAVTNADYASQLNTIGRNAKGSYDAAQPGIIAAGKVDGGQMAMGSLLQSAGTSYLGSGLGNAFGGDITAGQTAAAYGTNAGSAQTGMLAAQEAGMGTGGIQNYLRMMR